AELTYQIAHGPLTRIRNVIVEGEDVVTEERILRRVDLESGAIVDPDDLDRAEDDVYDLGMFFVVRAEPIKPTIDDALGDEAETFEAVDAYPWPAEVDVEVKVDEMPVHDLRFGFGAQIDNQAADVHLRFGYQVRHFFGNPRQLTFDLNPAWYFLPNFLDMQVNGPGGTAGVTYREPSVFEENLNLTTRAEYEMSVDYGYRRQKVLAS